jgi:hypothetical protein
MYDFTKVPNEGNTIYLEEGQFLDEVTTSFHDFKKGLPEGILNKNYTGVGATTVEFKSERKSIIVFPYRKIALEKFHKWRDSKKVYYVGTEENNHSKSIEEIAYFVENNQQENIKFCVVADSIHKVVEGIEKAGLDPYSKDFFLVLDEVEILQLQSGFRDKLPLCFEYFKKFKKKCLVSATLLDFSDEEISGLPVCHVIKSEYDASIGHLDYKEKIDFKQYKSNYPHIEVAKDILQFYKSDPKYDRYKFFIGLNSKDAIKQFIEEVKKENDKISISVIASEQSKDDFWDEYIESTIEDGILPSQINLSTCIAWSGIDLEEQFFSVAISVNTEVHHSFSFENLIQFFGRCRLSKNEQLSKTLVVGKNTELNYEKPDGDYIERVKNIESLIKFIEDTITSRSDRKWIFNALLAEKFSLIYTDIKNKPKANWLLKDLEIYTQKVVADYQDIKSGLFKKLQGRFEIEERETIFRELVVYEKSSEEKLEERLEILLSKFNKEYPDSKLVRHIRTTKMPTLRLAAYWYLFGRKVLGSEEAGLKLAKYYSGFSNELPPNGLLTITYLVLDGIYLYQFEPKIWESLINQLGTLCQGGKKRNASAFSDIFKKATFSPYFPSIINSKNLSTSIGSFLKYFIGVSSSGTTGGSQAFFIDAQKNKIPKIYKDYPSLKIKLNMIPKFPKMGEGISFGKISIKNILQEKFKLDAKKK